LPKAATESTPRTAGRTFGGAAARHGPLPRRRPTTSIPARPVDGERGSAEHIGPVKINFAGSPTLPVVAAWRPAPSRIEADPDGRPIGDTLVLPDPLARWQTEPMGEAKPVFFSAEIDALAAAVMAVGEAHKRAGMEGEDPDGRAVMAVLEVVRDGLAGTAEDELVRIGSAVMEWCSACYQLGQTAKRIRRRDFDSGRRLGRAEAEEEAVRQAWLVPLVAAMSA
jgi:hypothetical protein